MGIESLLLQNPQNTGPTEKGDSGRFDFMNKGMYPMSQMQRSNYANPTQVPLAAQAAMADYDPATNPLTGEPVSRFAVGGSVFKDDPNNFAADVTKAYKTLFGRDPSEQELRTNVNALNRDPDAYGWIVNKLSDSPEVDQAIKEGKVNLTPRTSISGESEVETSGKDAAVQDLLGAYGKFTPTPEPGGLAGFANKIGPYAPFLAAAAAVAGPAMFGEAALEGAAGATGALGAGEGVTVGAPILEPALGITSIAPEAASAAYPGMSAELAAELGLAGSSSGLSGAGASGDVLANMGIEGANKFGELTAKDALIAKLGLDMVTGGAGGQGGTGGSTTTTSTPFATNQNPYSLQYNPTTQTNPFTAAGMTNEGFYGYKPTTYGYDYGIKPLALKAPEIGFRSKGYAEGGIADLGGYAAGGKLLKGPGDGMSDSIVANIGGKQPARLADGEFVIPADVVSHLGNGSTDAGAKQLYKMMDRVRHARTGNKKQGKQINPSKFLPKG